MREPNLILVPFDLIVQPAIESTSDESEPLELELASNYNIIKILASIFQTVYGAFELYAARGNQLDKYGYAAYALTVVPYTMMSLVNLLAALCQPHYPSMFVVAYGEESIEGTNRTSSNIAEPGIEAMDGTPVTSNVAELKVKLGAKVGVVDENLDSGGYRSSSRVSNQLFLLAQFGLSLTFLGSFTTALWNRYHPFPVLLAIPYIMMKVITNFEKRQSTKSQRTWILVWLAMGQYLGPAMGLIKIISREKGFRFQISNLFSTLLLSDVWMEQYESQWVYGNWRVYLGGDQKRVGVEMSSPTVIRDDLMVHEMTRSQRHTITQATGSRLTRENELENFPPRKQKKRVGIRAPGVWR
ncbi:hypothetical protein K440DRAFT_642259 [Wilcoxina mikolae CBS 423.85]|nr:hypothetical protein K440DRAFT_642259 [Wilcoxina mikolae CBS 423.85]